MVLVNNFEENIDYIIHLSFCFILYLTSYWVLKRVKPGLDKFRENVAPFRHAEECVQGRGFFAKLMEKVKQMRNSGNSNVSRTILKWDLKARKVVLQLATIIYIIWVHVMLIVLPSPTCF